MRCLPDPPSRKIRVRKCLWRHGGFQGSLDEREQVVRDCLVTTHADLDDVLFDNVSILDQTTEGRT